MALADPLGQLFRKHSNASAEFVTMCSERLKDQLIFTDASHLILTHLSLTVVQYHSYRAPYPCPFDIRYAKNPERQPHLHF